MACENEKRTYISAPIKPGFAQLPDVPKNNDSFLALKNFLQSVKNVLEGTTPNNPVIPYKIENFVAATTTTGVRLTWDPDKNSAFYVIHRNNTNNFDQSRIVYAGYADHGKPSFFDVGGQDDTGAARFYWIRGYGPTGNAGILTGPLVSADPGIFAETEMIGPITDTLILLADGTTTKAVQDLIVGDELYPIDPRDPIIITEAPTPETKPCIEFETMTGKTLTIPETQLVHEYDGGMIPAIALVVGNEIRTVDGNEVITKRTKVGDQIVWRVRLNQKMWYTANRIWIWALGRGDAENNGTGFTGDSVFEMVTRAQQSVSSEARAYKSTLLRFDPGWFDGDPVFSIEVEAANTHATIDYDVRVQDADDLTVIADITIPANQTVATWQSTGPIALPAGERTYQMRLAQTASNNQLKANKLRIRVHMTNALTPVFYYPFMNTGLAVNNDDLVCGESRFTGGDSGSFEEPNAMYFLKEADAWQGVDHWSLDSVQGNTGSLGTNHAIVSFAKTDGSIVASTDSTSENSVAELLTTDFAHNATNFDDGDEFTIFSRATTTFFNNTLILKAGIYCFFSEFRRANVMYSVENSTRNRVNITETEGVLSAHYEVTAVENSVGTLSRQLLTAEGKAIDSTETAVAGTSVNPSGAKARYRRDFTTAVDRYYADDDIAGTGSADFIGGMVLLKVEGISGLGPYYYRIQRDFEDSESSVEMEFRIAQIGSATETTRARVNSAGRHDATGFGILDGNPGVNMDKDPRHVRRIRMEKGIITLWESEDSSSACDCSGGSGGSSCGDCPITVDSDGALEGDGTIASPLSVKVDGVTIQKNGSNELEAITGATTTISATAIGSEPGSPASGDVDLYTNSPLIARYNGSAWKKYLNGFLLTDPVDGDFSWENQGGASVTTTNGGIYLLAPATSGEQMRIRKKSAPSTPYTITACFTMDFTQNGNPAVGLGWRQSSDGKMAIAGIQIHSDAVKPNLMSGKYNSNTSYAGDYVRQPIGVCTTGVVPFWLQITDNGTNRICKYSVNGYTWHTYHTVGRTDFMTGNEVFFYANAINASWDCAIWLFSWAES